MRVNWKTILTSVLVVIFVVSLGTGSFYFGYRYGLEEPREVTLVLQGVNGTSTAADFNTFWQAWRIVKDEALHGEKLTDQDLLYGAIRGVVGALKDPHSVFLPPQDAKKFSDDISGSFGGVGMEIGKREGRLVVIAPLKGTPAERAGLQPNDYIVKVDNTFTETLDVEEAVNLIRGPKGTSVRLLISREDWTEPREFSVMRDTISIPTLDMEILENSIAHIKLYNFNEQVPKIFFDSLKEAEQKEVERVILDLRNNPGGFLEVAVHIAGWWLPKGMLVVSEEFRDGNGGQQFNSDGPGTLKNIPTVILVNSGSASASEILAGALRNQLHIKLIGTKTFGKGTVQTLKRLTDDSNIKITIANWVLPDGAVIEGNGITPDIEVKVAAEQVDKNEDPQLMKAVEIVKGIEQD